MRLRRRGRRRARRRRGARGGGGRGHRGRGGGTAQVVDEGHLGARPLTGHPRDIYELSNYLSIYLSIYTDMYLDKLSVHVYVQLLRLV